MNKKFYCGVSTLATTMSSEVNNIRSMGKTIYDLDIQVDPDTEGVEVTIFYTDAKPEYIVKGTESWHYDSVTGYLDFSTFREDLNTRGSASVSIVEVDVETNWKELADARDNAQEHLENSNFLSKIFNMKNTTPKIPELKIIVTVLMTTEQYNPDTSTATWTTTRTEE